MCDDEQPKTAAQTKYYEALFFGRVVGIIDQTGMLIRESSLRIFERDPVLAQVGCGLGRIPFEAQHNAHCTYEVRTVQAKRKRWWMRGLTLEMSGRLKGAKQPLERPLDRRVRLWLGAWSGVT